uniref:RING-type domain-containing protein n=1 Tax=Panagrellus redivivus TaxID=6233 RepID=A0A7E4W677_PANRE
MYKATNMMQLRHGQWRFTMKKDRKKRLTACRKCSKDISKTIASVCTFSCGHVYHMRCLCRTPLSTGNNCPKCISHPEKFQRTSKKFRISELPANTPWPVNKCSCCYTKVKLEKPVGCQLSCGHFFHHKCVHAFVKTHNQCPYCLVATDKPIRVELRRIHRKPKFDLKLETIVEEDCGFDE